MWTLAEIHSLTPLLNSLFFEWKNYTHKWPFLNLAYQDKCLSIELKKFSTIGHHKFTGSIFLEEKRLTFNEFLTILCEILVIEDRESFINRVLMSKKSIEEALRINFTHLENIAPNFLHTETALFVGHSLHPAPKSRSEFSDSDLRNFSPEHGASFKLSWFKVHRSVYFQEHSKHFNDSHWPDTLSSFKSCDEFHLLPVHPWQKERLLKLAVIQDYLEKKLLIDLVVDELLWTPTSSLRTVYNENSKYMVKFSLDVKMTNSVRHLLLHELKRGIQIDEVSKHPSLEAFFEEFPNFKIIQEPLFAGIIGPDQNIMIQTLIMLRENPFLPSDEVSLLATLTQPQVESEKGLLAKLMEESQLEARAWFGLFLQNAIAPFLILQGQYGILLGAHQQNLILKLSKGKPVGAYFRDCHGTGFDAKKITTLRKDIPSIEDENGNVLEQDISHYLFAYYLIINSVFNMITTISHEAQIEEESLLEVYRLFLIKLKNRVNFDPSFIDYLLHSDELKHKGNFFCTTQNINENTAKNPLTIYTTIKNPLKEITNV